MNQQPNTPYFTNIDKRVAKHSFKPPESLSAIPNSNPSSSSSSIVPRSCKIQILSSMKDHILISDGEDPVTPLPSLSKRARKDPISTILISDSDPTPQKQPPESSSTPIFVPETPLSDDFSVVKCSFGSGALASNREDKFSGSCSEFSRFSVFRFSFCIW